MQDLDTLLAACGPRFGVLAESDTHQLTVVAQNADVAIGDLFLLPSRRGPDRVFVFRTTEYANVLNRSFDLNELARNKLTMPDSYLSEDLADEQLIELRGIVLGYSELEVNAEWVFHRPRRLPQHLTDVFRVDPQHPGVADVVQALLRTELEPGDLYIGDLLAGEQGLAGVPVTLPAYALSHHIGIFGRTGSGKSNLMMVLLQSLLSHNKVIHEGQRTSSQLGSMFAIDPHDEFRTWHQARGGADGIRGIVNRYSDDDRRRLVDPFYYLTARPGDYGPLEARVRLSRADLTPEDLISVSEFSEQQAAFAHAYYAWHGERWVGRLLMGDQRSGEDTGEVAPEYLPMTVAAVQRRVGFLRHGHSRIFTRFDPDVGLPYDSLLPDIICALERGRIILVDTTMMNEIEQFLLTTVVARVLFSLRRALRAATSCESLEQEIRLALFNDEHGQVGQRHLADALIAQLGSGELPYIQSGQLRSPNDLPYVNVVIEEAPSLLNPIRMQFGSVFKDIARQGRKFGIGLTVVSQQVAAIDHDILAALNTNLILPLGGQSERMAAIRTAAGDLTGFERELQVLARGQSLLVASYRGVPLPTLTTNVDSLR